MLTKCFGIVSWLPADQKKRAQREKRLNHLFSQLSEVWPDTDILIITQNWKDFTPVEINNKIIRIDFAKGLGITKARQTLRKEFLKLNYDYIIMFDDDAAISYKTKDDTIKFMQDIDNHKDGFCFIHGEKNKYDSYKSAQLNLCAISRAIYAKEDIPSVEASKEQGYEDSIYACLLHYKYSKNEYTTSANITHTQFQDSGAPSTWNNGQNGNTLAKNTDKIKDYIVEHKDLPNIYLFIKYEILIGRNYDENNWYVKKLIENKKREQALQNERGFDGRRADSFLYF